MEKTIEQHLANAKKLTQGVTGIEIDKGAPEPMPPQYNQIQMPSLVKERVVKIKEVEEINRDENFVLTFDKNSILLQELRNLGTLMALKPKLIEALNIIDSLEKIKPELQTLLGLIK